MRIAFIGSRSSIHVVRWANAFARKGYEVSVFSMHNAGESFHPDVRVTKLPFRNPAGYILNIPFLRAKIRDLKPELVHSFYAFGHSFLARMSSQGTPHIVSVLWSDIYDDVYMSRLYKWIVKRNILSADVVCSTSYIMSRQIKKICNQDLDIKITPYGIDIQLFKPRPEVTRSENMVVFGTVKWLEFKYGIDTLIKAFEKFVHKYHVKNARLMTVGSGSREKEYRDLALKLDIYKYCEFAGKVPHSEVPKWLQKMEVFVALSRLHSESFGVAVLEAAAMELPVVVSNVGGLPEVIEDGVQGLVIPENDIDEAALAFKRYYDSESLRKAHGKQGRKRVLKYYTWRESVAIMEKIYTNVACNDNTNSPNS